MGSAKTMAALILAAAPTLSYAESAVCTSTVGSIGAQHVWRIEAHKVGLPIVSYQYVFGNKPGPAEKPVEVLEHWFSGIEGHDGLGISSMMVRQPDIDGYTLPSLITIDWTTLKFGHAFVPYLQERDNFMFADSTFVCQRFE